MFDRRDVDEYLDKVQNYWTVAGPAIVLTSLCATLSCCGCVLCYYRRYMRGLQKYEDSPQ